MPARQEKGKSETSFQVSHSSCRIPGRRQRCGRKRLQRFRTCAQIRHPAFGYYFAFIDDGGVIAQPFHHLKDVRGDEDGCSVAH